jgi:uncharacterized protein
MFTRIDTFKRRCLRGWPGILVLLVVLPVACMGATASDQLLARLQPAGYVNDFAGVIDAGPQRTLERALVELEQKTGAELTVVVLRSMEGGEIDDFTNRLFERWGVGKKGQDNGVMMLAALEDRKARIEVGYGLEPIITDGRAGTILRTLVFPSFKRGNYQEGLTAGAKELAAIIAEDAGVTLDGIPRSRTRSAGNEENPAAGVVQFIFLIIFILFFIRHPFLALMFLGGGPRGGGYGGGGGFSGGFGGFGGGLSGGGGASGGW